MTAAFPARPTEVCEALSDTFESSGTKISVTGGYTNEHRTMVYFIVNRFQVTRLNDLVHEIDPAAFITISEVADVFSANRKQK